MRGVRVPGCPRDEGQSDDDDPEEVIDKIVDDLEDMFNDFEEVVDDFDGGNQREPDGRGMSRMRVRLIIATIGAGGSLITLTQAVIPLLHGGGGCA